MVKYSVCITHRNMNRTIRLSLASVFSQLDEDYEVVVVDALSNDGSEEYLERLCREGRIRLFRERCSRGRGRDLAARLAGGEILIQQVDMDVVYRDVIPAAVSRFLELETIAPKVCLLWRGSGGADAEPVVLTVCRKGVVEELGGWPDLNYGEDWPFWRRASKRGMLVFERRDLCYRHLQLPWDRRWRDSLELRELFIREKVPFYQVLFGERLEASWKLVLRTPLAFLAYLRVRSRRAVE